MKKHLLIRLLFVVLCAALTFGGSFTCFASSGDDDVIIVPTQPRP